MNTRTRESAVPVADVLRVLAELVAWVAAPWALWRYSPLLAVLSLVLLIGLPAVIGTPGDSKKVVAPVAVPGWGTIGLVLMELAAAVAASWAVWPKPVAVLVTLLALACTVTEQPRWRQLSTLS
ncbi:hypothetical protein [Kitasatospora sp. McL0602]|uniref:hypothetical protein n=1 Tax=Kitasatospora sp. McL0602 TaxID=3439530 RepID=UPI003F8A61D0